MHGSTGQYEMYDQNLEHFASHGFVIVFPHIKSPEKDKKPLTTDTKGVYLMKAIDWALEQNQVKESPLYGLVDINKVIYAGHSMGVT